MPLHLPSLKEDCSRCAALCCLAYPFEAEEDFAILKRADSPCPNLDQGFRCTIHADLASKGFGGCKAYSCAGAGQRVTQILFEGETWQEDPDLLYHMTYALRVVQPIHEALLILQEIRALDLPPDLHQHCVALIRSLCPDNPRSVRDFEEEQVQDALAELHDFVETIAPFAMNLA
nr:hypothetical protein [Pseudophaeobacter sp. EL27]